MLTAKQKRFCEEYLLDFNATKAAIRSGYSMNRASEIGYQLLQKTTVRDMIQQLQKSLSEKTNISTERIINEFAKIAFQNQKCLFDKNGILIPLQNLPDEIASIIAEIKTKQVSKIGSPLVIETVYKLHSKIAALENLAKYLGLYERDNRQRSNDVQTVVIIPSNNRDD